MRIDKATQERNGQAGFTLVELLIVVIILGILAAIVVPQFGSSTSDAKESSLDTTLSEMRNAIELYYHQHGEYPGFRKNDGTLNPLPADAATAFLEQLTQYTDTDGVVSNVKDATHKFGPYLKKQALPNNPIDDLSALVINDGATVGQIDANGTDAGGWWFDTTSGKFIANIAAYYSR